MISSENSAIMYQKNKAFNKLYRCRDYVFLRHVFKLKNGLFIIDKSIENANIPPFTTMVRGQLTVLWKIITI